MRRAPMPTKPARTSSCPNCGASFVTATKEGQQRLGLHRLVHIELRHQRIRLTHALLPGPQVTPRQIAD